MCNVSYSLAVANPVTPTRAFEIAPNGANLGDMASSEYVTTQEAAEILGVSQSRIYALIRARRIEAQKFGRDWQVLRSSLEHEDVKDRRPGYPRGRKRDKTPDT